MTQAVRRARLSMGVAVIALVTAACSTSTPGSSNAGATPSASASSVPLLSGGMTTLSAGRYRVDPNLPVNVTVQVPAGWSGDTWVVIGPKGNQAPDGMAIRFYTVESLYTNPLSPDEGVLAPAVGPSVDDLVNAMVNHPKWTVTGHAAITMGGYTGQVVHVTLPPGTNDATPFYLSVNAVGDQIWGWVAGQLFDVYVVDVGGERLVVDAFHYANTTTEDLAAQSAVIDSIQLAP